MHNKVKNYIFHAIFKRRFAFWQIFLIFWFLIFSDGNLIHAQDLAQIKKEAPISVSGSLGAGGLFYGMTGSEARSKPFSYLFTGNLNLSIYGVAVPLSFVYSEQDRSFRQPFNQFGLSPKYKWVTVHLGYRNVDYSSFAFSGQTILGAGVDLSPGKFRFGFMYGRFNRAVAFNQSGLAPSTPSFERKGWTTRIGYGTSQQFVDLVLVRAQDDAKSISTDSVNPLYAAANMVVGLNSKVKISKTLSFEGEGAMSIFTENLNTYPVEGAGTFATNSAKGLIDVNSSTSAKTALRAQLQYKKKYFGTRLLYRRIDPSYKSMGTFYLNQDCQQISIEPSISLFKQKLMLKVSSGFQNDNLDHTKKRTTYKLINSVFASFTPNSHFAIDGNYANFQYNQQSGSQPLIDSTKTYQTNENLTISPRIIFAGSKRSHVLNLSYNFMRLIDNNKFTQDINEYAIHNLMAGYNLSLNELKLNFSSGFNFTEMVNKLTTVDLYGISVGVNKTLLENALSLSLPFTLQRNNSKANSAWIVTATIGINYKLKKHHNFAFNYNFIGNYSDNEQASPTFKEYKGALQYSFTF